MGKNIKVSMLGQLKREATVDYNDKNQKKNKKVPLKRKDRIYSNKFSLIEKAESD